MSGDTDITFRLHQATLDDGEFPRMKHERSHASVELVLEAADKIESLRKQLRRVGKNDLPKQPIENGIW